jgi:hypothetical protein
MRLLRWCHRLALRLGPRRCLALLLPAALLALGAGLGLWADRAARRGLRYDFVPGQRLHFSLDYLSTATLDLAPFQGGAAPSPGLTRSVHAAVRGDLVVQVLGVDGERVRLAYRLERPAVQLALDGQPDLALGQALEGHLQRAAFVEADRRGRILSARLAPGARGVSAGLSRALLAATQVVLPDPGADAADGWEAEEDGPHGTAVVRYEPAPGSAGWGGRLRALRKARLHYLPAEAEGGAAALEHRPEGELQATVDARAGHLVSVQGTEVTTTLVQGREAGRAETTLRLRLLRWETADAAEQARLAAEEAERALTSPPLPLSARPSPEEGEAAIHQAELGQATLETLLAELDRAERGEKGALGETPLYLKLKALAYLHPEVTGRLSERLARARAPGLAVRVLGPALADSGRPQAQAALVAVVRARRDDWPALAELLPALGRARAATPAVEAVLLELAAEGKDEVRSTAQLALGTLAHGLAATDPARAEAIVSWALGRLRAARSPAERRQLLLVLGNAGSATAWPALRAALRDPAPEVRGGAMTALGGLRGAEADAALCAALTGDADAGVRLEAARALSGRPMTAAGLAAHARVVKQEASPGVRLAALRNLGRARPALPEAAELIRAAAANDTNPEVRGAAAELLEEDGGTAPGP